jgi:hypothetical protein
VVEFTTRDGGPLKPAGDGVPGNLLDTSEIEEMLTPSTLSSTAVSNVALRRWRR